MSVETVAIEPETTPRERLWQALAREDVRHALFVLAAVFLHLFAVWIAMGAPLPWGPSLMEAVAIPQPPPKQEEERKFGDKAGTLDGIGAEIIDAAELDKRYISFRTGKDDADDPKEAPPPAPPQMEQPQQKPAEQAKPEPQETLPIQAPGAKKLTDADIAEILASSRLDASPDVQALTGKGAQARLGETSEFVRAVLRILKRGMPGPIGIRGSVVVRLVVGPAGDIEYIRVISSSGRLELDRHVLEKVRMTRVVPPDKNTSLAERTFQITYEYN